MNPYDVLQVSESATDEEVNKAYKALARKYHPDINPSKDAAEKMVQINCAYDEIKKLRENHQTYASFQQQNAYRQYQNSATSYQQAYQSEAYQQRLFEEVAQCINAGLYLNALMMLQANPIKNAPWYFYMGIVYARMGNVKVGKELIDEAIRLDPNNSEYVKHRQSLDKGVDKQNVFYRVNRNIKLFVVIMRALILILIVLSIVSCVRGCVA